MNREKLLNRAALVLLTAGFLFLGYRQQWARADGIPTTAPLVYSGTLEEGGAPVDGSRNIGLQLWDSETDTATVHMRCVTASAPIDVTSGRFQLTLDDSCTAVIHDTPDLWLDVQVAGASIGRTKLAAVPFAIEAGSASAASGTLALQVVPGGMIGMFAGACPTGWTEYLPMRGRFPRGEPTGSLMSLGTGGTDDAVVVSHTHTLSGSTVGGDHSHAAGGLVTSTAGGHTHLQNVGANSGGCPGSGVVRSDMVADIVNGCGYPQGLPTVSGGDHSHTVTGDTASASHTHTLSGTAVTTGVSGVGMNLPSYAELLFCQKL